MPRPVLTLDGPFFRGRPEQKFRRNLRDLMDELAEEGEAIAKANYPVGPGPDHARDGIVGRTKSTGGRRWAVTAVVSPTFVYPWRQPKPPNAQFRGGDNRKRALAFSRASRAVGKRIRTDLAKGLD